METIQKNMTEMKSKFVLEHEGEINKVTQKIIETKMKVEESEMGTSTKIKKGATEFVAEHEEEINKVKSKVEETSMKVEKKVKKHANKESRDSSNDDEVVSVDEIESNKKDHVGDESTANRDDPETPTDSIENETPLETNSERNSTTKKEENLSAENISVQTMKDTEGDETESSPVEDDDDSTNSGTKRTEQNNGTDSSSNGIETPQDEDGIKESTVKINKLKKTITDVRCKIEKTNKEVLDKEEVKKIVVPLKMKLVIAKAKLVELKERKSNNDETIATAKTKTKLLSEQVAANFVATAGNATKKVIGNNATYSLKKAASKAEIVEDDDNDNENEKKTKEGDSTRTSEDEIGLDASDNTNNKNEDTETKTKPKFPSEQVAVNFVTTAGKATKKVVQNARMSLQKAASKVGLILDDDDATLANLCRLCWVYEMEGDENDDDSVDLVQYGTIDEAALRCSRYEHNICLTIDWLSAR